MKTIIFDLDGTLADTSGDLIAATNACFHDLGHGDMLDPARDQAVAVTGMRAMLRLGFERLGRDGTAEIEAEIPKFLGHYRGSIAKHSYLYPGAVAALERLAAAGFALGICTNKPVDLAEVLVEKLGIRGHFGSLIGADSLPVRKPDAAPLIAAIEGAGGSRAQALLVGDTDTDRETARAAGVPSLLVTFGPDGHAVTRHAPEGLLHHFDDIEVEIAALIG